MKNCPFCGEEIQDTAKKCRFCGEWLNLIICPICGESIPANSVVCKFCNEKIGSIDNEVLDKNGVSDNVEKKTVVDEKNTKVSIQPVSPLKRIWADYSVIIIIVVLLLGYSVYRKILNSTQNYGTLAEESDISNYQSSGEAKSKKFKVETIDTYSNISDEYDSKYELELIGMDDGYILKNDLYSCKISEKKISEFVKSVNNKGVVEHCDALLQTKVDGNVSLGIFVDNSYATDNGGRIDISGPEKRIKSVQKILNMYKGDNIILYLGFLYATKENENLSEVINNRIIKLYTDNSSIGVKIKVYSGKKNPLEYFEKKDKITIDKVSFVLDYSDCVKMDDDEYSCYNVESLNNQIGQIYKKEFDRKELHSGNPLIEYFADQKIQGYFNLIDSAYILTDGQFEITDSYINLKKVATQMSNFSGYTVSNFYLDSYRKNQIPFEKFWNNNALKGGLGGINCEGIDISFVGLVGGNPGFTNFMHEYFSNKMFTGCNVTFVDY